LLGGGQTLGDQVFGTGDKVTERVLFVRLLAIAVPGFTQLPAATHVGNGKRHATLQQAQACVGEPRVQARTVGAIAVQIQWRGFTQLVALDHQADRHLGAIRRGGPQPLAHVIVGVEHAEYRGFLEHLLRAAGQFQLTNLGRAVQGFIAQADLVADKLQAVLYVEAVGGVR